MMSRHQSDDAMTVVTRLARGCRSDRGRLANTGRRRGGGDVGGDRSIELQSVCVANTDLEKSCPGDFHSVEMYNTRQSVADVEI